MNHEEAIISVALGAGSIIAGMGKKGEFYALGPGQKAKPDTKLVPRWFGRLWFIGIGALLIYWSLPGLRGTWHWSDLWADWWFFALFVGLWGGRALLQKYRLLSSTSEVQTLDLGRNQETRRNR